LPVVEHSKLHVPPAQSIWQSASPKHCMVQEPKSQVNVQEALPSQTIGHVPPWQSAVQLPVTAQMLQSP
jgi:hypothetical protein